MSKNILIVDDENDVCAVLREVLEHENFSVTVCNSGKDAFAKLQTGAFQAVLVDVRLEGALSGVDVIRECRSMAQRPKVIVISATPARHLAPIFEREGIADLIDRILEKPADVIPDVIGREVRNVLGEGPVAGGQR